MNIIKTEQNKKAYNYGHWNKYHKALLTAKNDTKIIWFWFQAYNQFLKHSRLLNFINMRKIFTVGIYLS